MNLFALTRKAFSRSVTPPNRLAVGSSNLDWGSLFFDYVPTAGHMQIEYKDGAWSKPFFVEEPFLKVHILGNVMHYGQALFEGMKAFHCRDDAVRVFSDRLNWERMASGCKRLHMPEIPWALWQDAVDEAIRRNEGYIPPYGSGGSMYLRPLMIGSGPRLGLGSAKEFTFIVIANPVGSYYRTKKLTPLDALIPENYDRAAPFGIGNIKAAANYAADLDSLMQAKAQGYPICLYLDAKEKKFVTEFNTSNFVAILDNGKTYLTPDAARAVLDSVTNRRLMQLADKVLNMKVERRVVDFMKEVNTWDEVGAVGTAVVVTPIKSITKGSEVFKFEKEPKTLQMMHDLFKAIQIGDEPDTLNWSRVVGPK